MRLDICRQGIEVDEEVREHIERRLNFALGRFGARVQRVAVHLADLNGPKGGEDKRCRLIARLAGAGIVAVEDVDADLTVLIDRAAERLGRTVQRNLERQRARGYGRIAMAEVG